MSCASMYLPFYEDCHDTIPTLFDEDGAQLGNRRLGPRDRHSAAAPLPPIRY